MDIHQEQLQPASDTSADLTSTSPSMAAWPAPVARPVMPVYSVDERLRKRQLKTFLGRLMLAALDILLINIAFMAAWYLRYMVLQGIAITTVYIYEPLSAFKSLEVAVTVGLLVAFWLKGLYLLRSTGTWFRQFWTVASATTIGFAVFSAYEYTFRQTDLFLSQTRAIVAFSWLTIIVVVSLGRGLVDINLSALYRRGIGLTNLVIVGSSRLGKLTMQQIAASPFLGYRIVGFIHDLEGPPVDFGRFKALGTLDDLDTVIRGNHIQEVIIAIPSHQHVQILHTVRTCERAGADFKLVPDLYELSLSRIDVDAVEGIPLIGLKRSLTNSWQYRVKRVIDIAGALIALVIGSPVLLLTALAIKLDSPGPVLYRQKRLGYRGQPFECLKFRSMHVNADNMLETLGVGPEAYERGKFKLKNDPRRTRVGRFIRRMSIDELPQLVNILKGEMSLIGPRPPLPSEFEKYEDWEKARLEMPPGLTGLWQVRGRSEIVFDEMVLMDLYYIENWSLRLDLQILLSTIPAVLKSRGAY